MHGKGIAAGFVAGAAVAATLWLLLAHSVAPRHAAEPPPQTANDAASAASNAAFSMAPAADDDPFGLRGQEPIAFLQTRQVIDLHTVAVDVRSGEKTMRGTGFVVEDGLVVSTAHIAQTTENPSAAPVSVLCNGKSSTGHIVAFDILRDVMVIAAPRCGGSPLSFATAPPNSREALLASGYEYAPDGSTRAQYMRNSSVIPDVILRSDDPLITDRSLADRLKLMEAQHLPAFVAVTGAFTPGNSGTPVVNSNGAVVGMISPIQWHHGRGFIVPAVSIIHVLKSIGYAPRLQ